ncbi:MAG: ribulose-phosphate 3-epimerase [Candidatus Undinarchaeales archaeon]
MRMKISPSILSADFANLGEEIKNIEPYADYIHIDVMDGHFVPNLTVGVPVVKSVKKITKLPLDVHLMIENPENFVSAFAEAGADILVVHAETISSSEIFEKIKSEGMKAGVSLNPDTKLEEIEPYLSEVDMVVIMSVNPGFSGQGFIDVSKKIKKLRASFEGDIEVDGGIKLHNIKDVADAGANVFVSGSGIFGTENPAETIRRMKEKIE